MSPALVLQRGVRVVLRRPRPDDQGAFLAAARASAALHRGYAHAPRTAAEFARYLARARRGDELHLVCRKGDGALVGVFNLGHVVRGDLQAATLGYYAFTPHAGQGLMSEGLALLLRQAFVRYKLHRLEADVQPANRASRALLRRAGFRREGFAPRLVKIGGRWRDHVRFAIDVTDWRAWRRRLSASGG